MGCVLLILERHSWGPILYPSDKLEHLSHWEFNSFLGKYHITKIECFVFYPAWLFDNRNNKLSLSSLLRLSPHRSSSQLKSNPRADFGGITRRGIDINLVCRIFLLLFMWQKCSLSTRLAPLITFLLFLHLPGKFLNKDFSVAFLGLDPSHHLYLQSSVLSDLWHRGLEDFTFYSKQ